MYSYLTFYPIINLFFTFSHQDSQKIKKKISKNDFYSLFCISKIKINGVLTF